MKRLLLITLFFFRLLTVTAAEKDTVYERFLTIKNPEKRIEKVNSAIEDCWQNGYYEKGLFLARKNLDDARKNHHEFGEALTLNHIGIIYDYKGDYAKSLSYYFKALAIQEKIKDVKGTAYTCSNIGLIYSTQGNYPEALKFHQRSLELRKSLNFKRGISASYNNIGIVYADQKNYSEALKNYLASVEIDTELGDERGQGDSYNNIGLIYMNIKDYAKAETYFLNAIAIREKFNDQMGMATAYNNLGTLYYHQQKYDLARSWFQKSMVLSTAIGARDLLKRSHDMLTEVEMETGHYKKALEHFKLYVAYKDSLDNDDITRQQTQTEMQYLFDKENARNQLIQQNRDALSKKEKENVEIVLWSVVALAILTLIFSIFLYKRWKVARQQKTIIEEKSLLVEIKNREILDSISYAKRIQSAILPPEKLVKEFLVNSFILYKPKDIVAGDFYWMEAQGNEVIFAAADCTGHGVPGALISVVCHNALNRSVREFGLTSPGEILDKTREIIIQEFEKSEDDVNDGMDISLCSLNLKTLELQWSGANNPLWLLRNAESEVYELKANKQPIGRYSRYETFDTHKLQLYKDDSLYLFTDGFADQFGGEYHKKFKVRQMKELVARMKDISMDEQRGIFDQVFEDWKGELEQVDDICVIGIRI